MNQNNIDVKNIREVKYSRKEKNQVAKEVRTQSSSNGIKKLKLLFTIVNRNKVDYYTDLIQSFDSNMQLITMATGTATKEIKDLIGIQSNEKAVLISVVREDMINEIMYVLDGKFRTIRDGSGIAFTIPLTSVAGVTLYRFLSNNR